MRWHLLNINDFQQGSIMSHNDLSTMEVDLTMRGWRWLWIWIKHWRYVFYNLIPYYYFMYTILDKGDFRNSGTVYFHSSVLLYFLGQRLQRTLFPGLISVICILEVLTASLQPHSGLVSYLLRDLSHYKETGEMHSMIKMLELQVKRKPKSQIYCTSSSSLNLHCLLLKDLARDLFLNAAAK